jgi:hypothetical protein
MVYINIPYIPENNRISKDLTQKELEALDISDDAKTSAFAAIYNRLPRGVPFAEDDLNQANLLERTLIRLGIPVRQSELPEFL